VRGVVLARVCDRNAQAMLAEARARLTQTDLQHIVAQSNELRARQSVKQVCVCVHGDAHRSRVRSGRVVFAHTDA
jgi:hypothetical protein